MSKIDEYVAERSKNDSNFAKLIEQENINLDLAVKVRDFRENMGMSQCEFASNLCCNNYVICYSTTLFVIWEHYDTVPMIDFSLFKNTNFDFASTATLFGQLLLVGFMVIVPTSLLLQIEINMILNKV